MLHLATPLLTWRKFDKVTKHLTIKSTVYIYRPAMKNKSKCETIHLGLNSFLLTLLHTRRRQPRNVHNDLRRSVSNQVSIQVAIFRILKPNQIKKKDRDNGIALTNIIRNSVSCIALSHLNRLSLVVGVSSQHNKQAVQKNSTHQVMIITGILQKFPAKKKSICKSVCHYDYGKLKA